MDEISLHLVRWLGQWPPARAVDIVGAQVRALPGWDGGLHRALGVRSPGDGAVLSVEPHRADAVSAAYDEAGSLAELGPRVPSLVGLPAHGWYEAVFRWCTEPASLSEVGEWVAALSPEAPEWLRPFGGEVLVARDPATGEHLAGVGLKRHDAYGHELAVVTEPRARGKGLAKALVAQAARRVLDEGAVPTYMHALGNAGSAAVADAVGFPDRGWRSFGVTEKPVRSG